MKDAELAIQTLPMNVRALAASLVFALLVAVGGYVWKGSPWLVGAKPGATVSAGAAPVGEGGAPEPPMDKAQFEALVDKLQQRLQGEPQNLEGWTMLARSYLVLGRASDALGAYAKVVALKPDDPNLLSDYADAMASASTLSEQRFEGEAGKLIDRALKIDPDHPKALALAGTAAFDRKDYAGAVKAWERVLAGNADHPFASQLREGVREARQLAGLPPAPAVEARQPAPGSLAQVSGRVSLAAALAGNAAPEDTVFVFARAAEGPRMPLAIVRKQVKDLPFDFKLDDTMAMSPQMKLSAFPKVVVGARISKGGDATARPGDLQGLSKPVEVGAQGVGIVISEVIAN